MKAKTTSTTTTTKQTASRKHRKLKLRKGRTLFTIIAIAMILFLTPKFQGNSKRIQPTRATETVQINNMGVNKLHDESVAKYYFDDSISDSEKESMFKFYTSDICQNFQPYYSARLERNVSAFEMYHLTRIIYSEAGNQEFRGKVAVAATVLNRLEDTSGLFENRIYDVIFQPEQFSSADIVDAERNTAGKYFSCGDELKYAQLDPGVEAECLNAAKVALDGEDPTRDYTTGAGALFFYNPEYCNENELSLRANIDDIIIIGDHFFFRNW